MVRKLILLLAVLSGVAFAQGPPTFSGGGGKSTPPCTSTNNSVQIDNSGAFGCAHATDNGTVIATTEGVSLAPTSTSQVGLITSNPTSTSVDLFEADINGTKDFWIGSTNPGEGFFGASAPNPTVGTSGGSVATEGTAFTGTSTNYGWYNNSTSHCFDVINQTTDIGCVLGVSSISASNLTVRFGTGGGTAQAQTVTLTPAITALATGLEVFWLPSNANSGAAPTLVVSGLASKPITKQGTAALIANDLTTTAIADAIYDGTEWQLQNPQTASGGGGSAFPLTVSGTVTSGGIPYFNSTTQESSSALLAANALVKGGGAGTAPSSSSLVDNGTTITTTEPIATGTACTATGSAGGICLLAGTANGHTTASTIVDEAPASVTAYEFVRQGSAATGIPLWTNASSVVTESILTSAAAGDLLVGTGTTWQKFAGNASGTQCLQENSSGTAAWGTCGGTSAWSALTAPTASLSLTMPAGDYTSMTWAAQASPANPDWLWTAGADTGTSTVNAFSFVDTTANTKTGALLNVNTVGSSTALPFQATAQGTANGIQMTTAGLLQPIGTGGIKATALPVSGLTAATGSATIANGNNPIVWNWALGAGPVTGFTIGETTAGATAGDILDQISTLTTSTAIPLQITQGAAGPAATNAPPVLNISAAAAGGAASASINGLTGAPISLLTGAGSAGGATTGNGGTGGAFTVALGAGGAHGGTTTNTGGVGGAFSLTPGAGTQGAATGAGGAAGTLTVAGAAGGAGGSTSGTGGAGSDFLVTTGTGGAATSGSTTGRGGNAVFTLGSAGGTGTAGAPGQFEIVGGTVGAANTTPFVNVTGTWNTTGVVDAALFLNITNTASGTGSLLADLQLGGTSQWKVDKAGNSTQVGSAFVGTSAPAITAGASGGVGCVEGTAPTTLSGSDIVYCDSTLHDVGVFANGGVKKLVASSIGYNSGSVSASIGSTNVASSANFPTGQYVLSCDVAVTAVGSSPTLAVTIGWTDITGTARTKTCTTGVVTVSDNPVTQTITSNGSAAITVTQTLAVSTATWWTTVGLTRLQ